MEENINHIFRRQFERCKGELIQANCPQCYIDCFSRFLRFANEDVITEVRKQDYGMAPDTYR